LALWLAKKDELIEHDEAGFDLVMAGWIDASEADLIRSRHPFTRFFAGLTHTWILDDPAWLNLLQSVANAGKPDGPMQITEEMYLVMDDDGDGIADRKCSLPGWEDIHAMDPRHPAWRQLILSFYENIAEQPQHDGIIIDMLDAYPFCEGAWSGGVPTPIDTSTWISAQSEILGLIRYQIPPGKMIIANAGRDFPPESTFPQHLNGYLLENFLGSWGADLELGLASAQRATETTRPPHSVIFAVDTDDTGQIDWRRFRVGFAASMLLDNTYFAFDFGPRDHGGVSEWWFPEFYGINLGEPLGSYRKSEGIYRRDFTWGAVVVAAEGEAILSFDAPHEEIFSRQISEVFVVPNGDAGVFLQDEAGPLAPLDR
jgi:hypothetical protein